MVQISNCSFIQILGPKLVPELLVYLSDLFVEICCAFIQDVVVLVVMAMTKIIPQRWKVILFSGVVFSG